MAQVAEAALVSKSTAYRYFPSQEAIMAEALLEAVNQRELAAVFTAARPPAAAAVRLDAVVRADHALVVKHEAAFRSAGRPLMAPRADDPSDVPRRPGNRLCYLAEALAPLEAQLGAARLQRLALTLALCIGMESIMVMVVIGGLSPEDGETVKRLAAAALPRAALDEVSPAAGMPDRGPDCLIPG